MKLYYNGQYKIIDESGNEIIYKDKNNILDFENEITEIEIEPGTTEIGRRAFSWFKSLEKVTIPNSVTKINDDAFLLCESLKEIKIPDSVTEIGEEAFARCEFLDKVIFENNPDLIIRYTAFEKCPFLNDKTREKIICQIAKDVPWGEVQRFIQIYDIKYNNELLQELITINIKFFRKANNIDQEVFLDAALDSINNIYKKDNKLIIKTSLCNIKIIDNKLFLSLDDNDFQQVNSIFIDKIKNAIEISKGKGDINNESVL